MMPKINSTKIKEGDVITKSALTETIDALEDVDFIVDQENIREEGLDRRVFDDGCVVGSYQNPVRATTSEFLQRGIDSSWRRPRFPSERLVNSEHSNYPEAHFTLDPETDTHVVLRCSFAVDTRDAAHKPWYKNDFWDFGLVIVPPDHDGYTTESLQTNMNRYSEGVSVWPYTRVQLSPAFSNLSGSGHLSRSESRIAPTHDYDSTDKYDSDIFTDPIEVTFRDTQAGDQLSSWSATEFEKWYPRGGWNQYTNQRQSNLYQSCTLIHNLTSKLSLPGGETFGFTGLRESAQLFEKAGKYKVYLVYRHNISYWATFSLSEEPYNMYAHDHPKPKIGFLDLSHTIYKR